MFVGKLASLRFQPGRVSSLLAVASAVKKVTSEAQIAPPLRNPRGSCSRVMSLSCSFCYIAPTFCLADLYGEAPTGHPHSLARTPARLQLQGLARSQAHRTAQGMFERMREGQLLVSSRRKKHFSLLQCVDLTSWVGQNVRLGFCHKMLQRNPNELFSQPKQTLIQTTTRKERLGISWGDLNIGSLAVLKDYYCI